MNRPSLCIALVVAGATLAAACSSSSSPSSGDGVSPKFCALASACSGAGTLFTFGQLCEALDGEANLDPSLAGTSAAPIHAELECAEGASDCAAFQACLTVPASAAAKCTAGTQGVCADGYAVSCDAPKLGGLTQGSNCQGAELMCATDSSGAGCGTASCDAATTQPTCDGDNLVTCSEPGGVLTSVNCKVEVETSCSGTSSGSSCTTNVSNTCAVVDGMAQCVGNGPACDPTTFKATCNGTTIVTCTGGKTATYDCTMQDPDATCGMADGVIDCVGTGTECTDSTSESCADGVITYCMWGTKTTVDCKSYGLSGCTTFQTGNGSQVGAACTE